MTDREIIKLLNWTGHLEFPFGKKQEMPNNYLLTHPATIKAVASFQDFMIEHLDPLCLYHHSRPARCDGEIKVATRHLMELPRCGCPDYGKDVQPAVGTGSWAKCHNIGDFHAATVYVDDRKMSSSLKDVFDQVWDGCIAAYEEIGLRFIRTNDEESANIKMSFVTRSNGWIGLAIVGRGQSCGSQIWCQFLAPFNPREFIKYWIRLLMHEFGHNASLLHTRGGVMNAIITGGPISWAGDPSESILKRHYGGKPIVSGPRGPTPTPRNRLYVDGKEYDVTPRGVHVPL